ncbi:MAG: hypothetical protein F6K42_27280 [Leptolyngbya sp. SIO1D8]|nr:hypothetical protein [Leptolyngbya sp. SIO1D8]
MNPGYDAYLNSEAWQHKRQQVLERDDWQCRCCDAISQGRYSIEDLQVHHRHYDNFGHEPLEDLTTLCPECHDAITAVHRRRRYRAQTLPDVCPEPTLSRSIEVTKYDTEVSDLSAHGACPDHPAQRTHRQSVRSVGQGSQSYLKQAFQDRC